MQYKLPDWLKARISAAKLTEAHKRVVKALAVDPDDFLCVSVQEFAAKAGVSPATITRLTRVLGYDSYAEFQQDMKERIFQPQITAPFLSNPDAAANSSNLLRRVHDAETDELERNLKLIDAASFSEAARLTARAEHVYLVGFGSSVALLRFLQHRLMQMGLNVIDMTQVSELNMLAEYSVHIDARRDVIISISFWGVYGTISHLLRFAKAFGIPSIAFSENQQSEISRLSNYRVPIKRAVINEFHSLSVPMSVLNLFTMHIARHKAPAKPSITKRLLWFKRYNESRKR